MFRHLYDDNAVCSLLKYATDNVTIRYNDNMPLVSKNTLIQWPFAIDVISIYLRNWEYLKKKTHTQYFGGVFIANYGQ